MLQECRIVKLLINTVIQIATLFVYLIFTACSRIISGLLVSVTEAHMGVVTSEIIVSRDPVIVFKIASEVEKYPDFMPDVESADVIERRDDGYARVAWVGHARVGSIDKIVKWTEDAWWNLDSLTSTFELVEGDYKHYKGDWTFTPSDSDTKIRLTIDFDLGLPLVGPLIVKLLDNIMQNNIDGMLKAIKERAESE